MIKGISWLTSIKFGEKQVKEVKDALVKHNFVRIDAKEDNFVKIDTKKHNVVKIDIKNAKKAKEL